MNFTEEKIILGIMSGTSLDGLDFALCKFKKSYSYKLLKTGFSSYDLNMKKSLSEAQNLNAFEFVEFHKNYGKYIGQKVNEFLKDEKKPDYISSHGHTIFHKPKEKITFQIGDAAFIAAETNIPVISDFRNLDTALGGQGAPLVPIGDKCLFPEYEFCINLGGFANISYEDKNNKRIAYDICPVNFILNQFANQFGEDYDKGGNIGKKGIVNIKLLEDLNGIPFYDNKPPKSLGREYVERYFIPILKNYNISVEDKARTFYKHIAIRISKVIQSEKEAKILFTGGGAHNQFLMSEIKKEIPHRIIIPQKGIVDFKEAIIFAFLGFLRINNEINTLKTVTGANRDSIGGSIYLC